MGPFVAIRGHMVPYRAIQRHTGPKGAIWSHKGPYRTIRGQRGPYGLYWTILNYTAHIGLYMAIRDHNEP